FPRAADVFLVSFPGCIAAASAAPSPGLVGITTLDEDGNQIVKYTNATANPPISTGTIPVRNLALVLGFSPWRTDSAPRAAVRSVIHGGGEDSVRISQPIKRIAASPITTKAKLTRLAR